MKSLAPRPASIASTTSRSPPRPWRIARLAVDGDDTPSLQAVDEEEIHEQTRVPVDVRLAVGRDPAHHECHPRRVRGHQPLPELLLPGRVVDPTDRSGN